MGCGSTKQEKNSIIVKPHNEDPGSSISKAVITDHSTHNVKLHSTAHVIIKNPALLSQNYLQSVKIGEGSHGFVRVATHKISGQKRAIKSIEKSKFSEAERRDMFLNEINILKQMDHPNIVKLFEFYEDNTHFHLVTEYVAGGELFDYIISTKRLSECIAANFMRQILSAIAYCHDNNIAHRDINPENLLLDKEGAEAVIKIIDFGKASIINHRSKNKSKHGNAYYIAPEIYSNSENNEKCDIWSCGVVLYILLCGKPPFNGRKDEEIVKRVMSGVVSFSDPIWESISNDAIKLIKKMLVVNPKNRISAKDALRDTWVTGNMKIRTVTQDDIPLSRLMTFHQEKKLETAVLKFIGSALIGKEESKRMYESFKSIDRNGDGKLSKEELLEAYTKLRSNKQAALEEVERLMESVDVNGSGFIDYSEFITACIKKDHILINNNLDVAFKAFDIDGSGKITVAELKEILGVAEDTDHAIDELLRNVDENGDGDIDINEFKEMMIQFFNKH